MRIRSKNPANSVSVVQTKLDQPSRNDGRRDLTKRRRRSNVYAGWETKNRVIPHVEDIHAETQLMAFPDSEILQH